MDQVTWLHNRSKAKAALSEGDQIRVAGQQCAFISLKRFPLAGIDRFGPPYLPFSYLDVHVRRIRRMVVGMPQ